MDEENDSSGPPPGAEGGPADPERAFRLLGDETRLAILRALWETDGEAVPFTALRERLGDPDSGRFNYHLGELVGHFVAKAADGYALTQAGREVVRAVLAGAVTGRPAPGSVEIGGECADCGGSLVFRYDGRAAIECGDCGETLMWNEFPPAGVTDRSAEAAARAFERWTRARFRLAVEGVCPSCAAGTAASLDVPDGGGTPATLHRCGNCRYEARVPLFARAVEHPAVVAHYHERGVDVTGLRYRELLALGRGFDVDATAAEPRRATVTVPDGDGSLRLVLDDDLDLSLEGDGG